MLIDPQGSDVSIKVSSTDDFVSYDAETAAIVLSNVLLLTTDEDIGIKRISIILTAETEGYQTHQEYKINLEIAAVEV